MKNIGKMMKQAQEMPTNRIVMRLQLDPFAAGAEVMPVEQHRTHAGH